MTEMQRAGGVAINEQRMRHLEQLAGEAGLFGLTAF